MKIPRLPRKIRIPLIYGLFSILWIFFSDQAVSNLAANPQSTTLIAIVKGTLFVVVSTCLIFILLKADERQQTNLETEVNLIKDSFSTLFDANPQPMWINDPESFQFIAVNEAAMQLFGYSRPEFLALTIPHLCVTEELPQLKEAILNRKEGLRRTGPWQLVTCTGKQLFAYIVVVDIDFSGRKANLSAVIDISEQRIIEETLKKTVTERDDFEAFSFSVSHDLRATLRAVNGYDQILREDYAAVLDEKGRGYLDKLHQASQAMNKTIDNLLMLSGITHRSLQSEKVDLAAVAREVTDELQENDPQRQVDFVLIPEVYAWGDPDLMHIVLFQLMENAWKYSSKNPAARIEFGCADERTFFVKDNGAGFDPTKTKDMFKPFQRFHPATEFDGSGIGLSVVARIIERHHGKIWAVGQVNQGATFYFTLGLKEAA